MFLDSQEMLVSRVLANLFQALPVPKEREAGRGGGGGFAHKQNLENDPRRVPDIGQKLSGLRHFLPNSKHRSAGQLAVIKKWSFLN